MPTEHYSLMKPCVRRASTSLFHLQLISAGIVLKNAAWMYKQSTFNCAARAPSIDPPLGNPSGSASFSLLQTANVPFK